jgi:hypothetical protein
LQDVAHEQKKTTKLMTWPERAFKALDSEGRGYLFKHELLNHINASGTYTNYQLLQIVQWLESKAPKDRIEYTEFEAQISGKLFIKNVLQNQLVIPQY